jgi:hypothetical protein
VRSQAGVQKPHLVLSVIVEREAPNDYESAAISQAPQNLRCRGSERRKREIFTLKQACFGAALPGVSDRRFEFVPGLFTK